MTTKFASRPFGHATVEKTCAQVWSILAPKLRSHADARALDDMPAERLADIGLAPCTPANFRSSGDYGSIPRADLF